MQSSNNQLPRVTIRCGCLAALAMCCLVGCQPAKPGASTPGSFPTNDPAQGTSAGRTLQDDYTKTSSSLDFGRIDAQAGRPLALVLDPKRDKPETFSARLADGRQLQSAVYRVSIPASGPLTTWSDRGGSNATAWLGLTGRWDTTSFADAPREAGARETKDWQASIISQPATMLIALVDIPPDPVGDTIFIGERAIPAAFLANAEALYPPTAANWPSMLTSQEASNSQQFLQLLREVGNNPLDRWRVRLLIDGLRSSVAPVPFDNEVIEALAQQVESRWRLALARLAVADPDLCLRLKKRLCTIIEFGDGLFVPAWPTDRYSLDRLLADLLTPNLRVGALITRAEQWLAEQPQAALWLQDTGGTLSTGPKPLVIPFVGIANLTDKSTTTWGYTGFAPPPTPEILPLQPFSAISFVPRRSELLDPDAADSQRTIIHVGKWNATLPTKTSLLPIVPPRLDITGFTLDLSMDAWLYGRPLAEDPAWATIALLTRAAPGMGSDPQAGSDDSEWELFVQCRLQPGIGQVSGEKVTIFSGPATAAYHEIQVDSSGLATRSPDGTQRHIRIAKTQSSWSFRIRLPQRAIEAGGVVRLGITRHDSLGRRSAWPLPMLPWQPAPARAALTTRAWSGLNQP